MLASHKRTPCSVVIVSYNSRSTIPDCLIPLVPIHGIEIIVVDNASSDDVVEIIKKEFPSVILLPLPENVGFGKACNKGVEISHGEYLFFLNPDAWTNLTTLNIFSQFLIDRPDVGIVGGQLVGPDGFLLASIGDYPTIWRLIFEKFLAFFAKYAPIKGFFRSMLGKLCSKYALYNEPVSVPWVSGAALCCRRSTFDSIDGFDEKFFLYYEDVDFCLRARKANWGVWHIPSAVVHHLSGASFGGDVNKQKEIYYKNQYYYFEKHYGIFMAQVLGYLQKVYYCLGLYNKFGTERIGHANQKNDR